MSGTIKVFGEVKAGGKVEIFFGKLEVCSKKVQSFLGNLKVLLGFYVQTWKICHVGHPNKSQNTYPSLF